VGIYLARTVLPFTGTFLLAVAIYFWFSAPILAAVKETLNRRTRVPAR
jgi:hypothetical protein